MKLQLMMVAAGAAVAAGCASVPEQNQALLAARSNYQLAASDPFVLRAAPIELARAEEHLGRAEAAWKGREDSADVNHLAYLANQQALIASERGKLAQAEQIVEAASAERNKALLESRNRQLLTERQASRSALEEQQQARAVAEERARTASGVAAQQAQRASQLQSELDELAARQTPMGMVMTLGDVLFDVGKSALKPGAERSVDRLTEFLNKHPERKVRIEGFTDSTGTAEINQELSRQRAEEVRQELTRRGISPERIQAVGYGPSFPIATNKTAAGRQQNRRVEIVISDETGNVGSRR